MSRLLEELTAQEKRNLIGAIEEKKNGLSDKDWSEIVEEYDLGINAETLRKAGVGIKLAADAGMLGGGQENGYIERQKMRDLTKQVNQMYRTQSRSELLRETIRETVKALPQAGQYKWTPVRLDSDNGNKALTLAVGDFHYGAEIKIKGLRGETVNQYDHNVFEARMERLLAETRKIVIKERPHTLYLFLMGDMLDGMLRQSQLMRLEYGLVESTIQLAEYLAKWIQRLYIETGCLVSVHAVSGNHSEVRPLKAKNREFEEENLEKIIMWYLESRLAEDGIYIDASCERMNYVTVEGFNFLLLHGDEERSIPDVARNAVNLYGEPIDFFVCAHKHREQEYPSGFTPDGNSVIVRVPSICGPDRYAQTKHYGGSAGAIAMLIEHDYGRRCVYPIKL